VGLEEIPKSQGERAKLFLDKKIPNDSGSMNAVLEGIRYPYLQIALNETLDPGVPTDGLILLIPSTLRGTSWDFARLAKAFVNQRVLIYLDNYQPAISDTNTIIEELKGLRSAIESQTSIIQSNQGSL